MLNFASLFNQFRSQSNNGLTDLLEQPNTKMGRLLDQDSFLNDYKSGNSRVMDFMKYDKYQELVQFITVVGNPDDKKRAYKYPLSASELLSIENNTTVEFFFPEKTLTIDQKISQEVQVEVQEEIQEPAEQKEPEEQSDVVEITENVQAKVEAQPKKTQEIATIVQEPENIETQVITDVLQNQKKQEQSENVAAVTTKTRKVIRKELKTVQKIVKRQVQPLITMLMAYFDGQVNYTLAGYVSKVLTVFFNKKPAEFLRYILQGNIAEKILNHAESRSVGDLIIKILSHEATLNLDQRRDFFKALLERLSKPSEIHILSNLSSYVSEIIEKIAANLKGNNKIVEFNNVFFSLDVITQVIKNVMSDEELTSVYNAPILLTYLTNVPFVLPEDETIVEEFKKLLEHFIQKSCEKLQVNGRIRPKIGTGRIKIIQILRYILKQNVLNTLQMVGKREDFFDILYNLMKEYQMNNLLHNQIMKIVQIALGQSENSLINISILKDDTLLKFIIDEANEDKKIKAGDSIYKSRKGYIAHIINLCIKLKELADKNTNIKKLVENPQFVSVYETFIEKEVVNSKKPLAGYSMRKDIKHQIMFLKEDIIAAYSTFFQKCPASVFEKEVEHVNIEHPDLVEELQKQLEENLSVKSKDETQQTTEEKKAEGHSSEAQLLTPPNFWVVHLQYDVNDLLIDL